MDKTFCPTCGNPTLLRTAVSSSASGSEVVHLKPNFVYRNRGTKYSLPTPRASKAGGAREAVPILRADQQEWTRGVAHEKVRKEKEERRAMKDAERGGDGWSSRYQNVEDLSVLLAGGTGKERREEGGLPRLGIGRKNPNERRRPRA
jgi:RNA-binding protein NOB1